VQYAKKNVLIIKVIKIGQFHTSTVYLRGLYAVQIEPNKKLRYGRANNEDAVSCFACYLQNLAVNKS